MGKEAKIGLAIVGTLLVVFSALLFRKLMPAGAIFHDADGKQSADALAADAPAGESTVAAAQNEALRAATSGEMPTADPFSGVSGRQSAQVEERAERAPRRLDVADKEISALPRREQAEQVAANPVRRLSAEEPTVTSPENALEDNSPADNGAADNVPVDDGLVGNGPADDNFSTPVTTELNGTDAPPQVNTDLDAAPRSLEPAQDPPATNDRYAMPPTVPVDRAARPRHREPIERTVEPTAATDETPHRLADDKYTVQPNDNLWIISEKVYGTGRYFKAIQEHNRAVLPQPHRLTVGSVLSTPPANVLEEKYPSLCPKQRRSAVVRPRTLEASTRPSRVTSADAYVVEEGDTLFDIARWELGKASRWAEIYDLNREALGEDFDYLQPGTELKMPAKDPGGDSMTRQRDSRYTR